MEDQKSQATSQGQAPASAQVPDQAQTMGAGGHRTRGAFMTVPADPHPRMPPARLGRFSWQGSGQGAGERMDYTCRAGHLDVRDDAGALTCQMFSLTYQVVDGRCQADPARPVTFAFNGGPGCASVPINFGGIGPRRVRTDGVSHLGRPVQVEDNPATLLRQSDLVFLDAPGTGWSTVAEGADTSRLFGVDGDADAFCRAICQWLEENDRWSSPLYLFGESYGTVRNAVLCRLLGERGVLVTGVTLLSAIMDWVQVIEGEDLYQLGMMPTMAATAHFHGKVGQGQTAEDWFERAMAWNEEVYAPALLRGDRLGAQREREVAEGLSGLIGLPARKLARQHLRVPLDDFRRNLLWEEGRVCGRLDTRFTSDAPLATQGDADWFAAEDAADDAVEASWTCAFRDFLSRDLGYHGPATYLSSNYERVGVGWKWEHAEPGRSGSNPSPNVAYDLAVALRRNPCMKVCVMGGRYDAATTYWNVVHDLSCQFLSDAAKGRVEWHLYDCGHMAYVDLPTLGRMARDLAAFYARP